MATPARREAIAEALFALLSQAPGTGFVTVGRRLVDPENTATKDNPAFYLIGHEEEFVQDQPNHPLKQVMTFAAYLYVDVGNDAASQNAIPDTQLNTIIDALVTALKPDNMVTRLQTLGGLVTAVWLSGQAPHASGDTTGKGAVVLPIKVLMP